MTPFLPFELVDAVLEETRAVQRRLRDLPSRSPSRPRPDQQPHEPRPCSPAGGTRAAMAGQRDRRASRRRHPGRHPSTTRPLDREMADQKGPHRPLRSSDSARDHHLA
ncbi:transposase domain-containing protein [Streptosporangium vulgare]|uniref:Transposase domain-containing protein n=1 Tax=Streptosporangium vulgare TaxID=46190 RepID=A0ABV5TIZ0_9ACTN